MAALVVTSLAFECSDSLGIKNQSTCNAQMSTANTSSTRVAIKEVKVRRACMKGHPFPIT
eukprot:5519463-Amphidinium_carterae.1